MRAGALNEQVYSFSAVSIDIFYSLGCVSCLSQLPAADLKPDGSMSRK